MRLVVLAALVLLPATSAHAAEAAYTDLNLDACEVLETFEEGVGAALKCDGLAGVPIFVTEVDLRFDLDFGVPDGSYDSFAPFNSVGSRVEWRVVEGEPPYAGILRFAIERPEGTADPPGKGSVLGVFKVGTEEARGCPIAYVDAVANEDANEMARQVADAFARPFRCGMDRATYVGKVGPLSGSASATSLSPE